MRVPPKLMAGARATARSYSKSDPIDARAVARAVLREPGLPVAQLDGPDREVRLLVDHRDALAAERTRAVSQLRWHLHELDPSWDPRARSLDRASAYDTLAHRLGDYDAPWPGWPARRSSGAAGSRPTSTRWRRKSPR